MNTPRLYAVAISATGIHKDGWVMADLHNSLFLHTDDTSVEQHIYATACKVYPAEDGWKHYQTCHSEIEQGATFGNERYRITWSVEDLAYHTPDRTMEGQP